MAVLNLDCPSEVVLNEAHLASAFANSARGRADIDDGDHKVQNPWCENLPSVECMVKRQKRITTGKERDLGGRLI
jgi:hypothetical protein